MTTTAVAGIGHKVARSSSTSTPKREEASGGGDNVMAELQSKLKGRGKIEPIRSGTCTSSGSPCHSPSSKSSTVSPTKLPNKITKSKSNSPNSSPGFKAKKLVSIMPTTSVLSSSSSTSTKNTTSKVINKSVTRSEASPHNDILSESSEEETSDVVKTMTLNLGSCSPTEDRSSKSPYLPTTIKLDVTNERGSLSLGKDDNDIKVSHNTPTDVVKPIIKMNPSDTKTVSKPASGAVSVSSSPKSTSSSYVTTVTSGTKPDVKKVVSTGKNTSKAKGKLQFSSPPSPRKSSLNDRGGVRELARIFSARSKEQDVGIQEAKNLKSVPKTSPLLDRVNNEKSKNPAISPTTSKDNKKSSSSSTTSPQRQTPTVTTSSPARSPVATKSKNQAEVNVSILNTLKATKEDTIELKVSEKPDDSWSDLIACQNIPINSSMFGDNEELSQTVVVIPEEDTTLPQCVNDDVHTDTGNQYQSDMSLTTPSNQVHELQCSDDNTTTKVALDVTEEASLVNHHYQNVFDEHVYLQHMKHKTPKSSPSAKKPMPTPRKNSPSTDTSKDETDSDYEDMNAFSKNSTQVLKKLQSEIDLLQDIVKLPPLGETEDKADVSTKMSHKKATKSQSNNIPVSRRTKPKSLKELRKGVVTDVDNCEEEYITMSPVNSQLVSDESESEYYLPVLPGLDSKESDEDQYMEMHNPYCNEKCSNNRNSPTRAIKRDPPVNVKLSDQISNWKRSQGSIFAQEMINFMGEQESLYCKIPEKRPVRGSSSYQPLLLPFPVTSRPPVGTTGLAVNNSYTSLAQPSLNNLPAFQLSSLKQVGTFSIGDTLSPPVLPPKSESLLREQGIYPNQSQSSPHQAKSEKKKLKVTGSSPSEGSAKGELTQSSSAFTNAKDIIRALKKQTFSSNPKTKSQDKKLTATRKPLALPSKKFDDLPDLPSSPVTFKDYSSLDLTLERSNSSPDIIDCKRTQLSHSSSGAIGQDLDGNLSSVKSESEHPLSVKREYEPHPVVKCRTHQQCSQLTKKINRDSLAIILDNRHLISNHLKQRSVRKGSSHEKETEVTHSLSPKRSKETLIRSLGEILLEINDLLQDSPSNDEANLITAIERELNLKLNVCPHQIPSQCQVNTSPKHIRFQDIPQEIPVDPFFDELYEQVVLTEKDVEDVVKYVDENCLIEIKKESIAKPGILQGRQSKLRRSLSEAVILNPTDNSVYRSDSVSSLQSNPEANHRSESSDDDDYESVDITQSITFGTNKKEKLERKNAKRRPTAAAEDIIYASIASASNGVGYFTSVGGTLRNRDSSVVVEVPPGAITKGRRQKLWFEVLQTVYKDSDENELKAALSISDSVGAASDVKTDVHKKKDGKIQLSPVVLVGPGDAVLRKPIKINIPHCVPTENTAWKIKAVGRGHNCQTDDWISLSQSSGKFVPRPGQSKKNYKNSTYQLYPSYVRVKTKQPGCFRLTGRPVGQSAMKTTKKMVCSIYTEPQKRDKFVRIKVFFVNAILDSVMALDKALISEGYTCVERNIPLLCYGNQRDFEVSLMMDSEQGLTHISTQTIPFGVFWRVTRIGQARVTFDLHQTLLTAGKLFSIRVCQADKDPLEIQFMLP